MSYHVYLRKHVGRAQITMSSSSKQNQPEVGFFSRLNIQQGMAFGYKRAKPSEESETCLGQEKIGTVTKANFNKIQSIVETLPPPPNQFNGAKRINPSALLLRCQEWTADAIQLLKDEGVLET
ncbi:hypothetical protein BCR34DRAFT_136149 [Clohesyomyces aquaticus]|uniref:Uncharacterized protein n=1 Tax=Clohesyomyces aquaticus TaxID=1231657 RepID=A0A1Y2AAP6_9PLEO|nr:hypothetical protein BCR34DRAFT_136149 [Clohesyomyces aquaticus]